MNINYVFNPHIDVEDGTLRPETLVKLINSTWTLLHYYKNATEKVERLVEQNDMLERNNRQLNVSTYCIHTLPPLVKRSVPFGRM